MNSLSWLLYLSDVLPALSESLVGLSFALGSCTIVSSIGLCLAISEHNEKAQEMFKSFMRYTIRLFFPFLLVGLLIPSKETFYLIAGSEVGEVVVQSEEAKEILNDVHAVIKHQLKTLKGEGGD